MVGGSARSMEGREYFLGWGGGQGEETKKWGWWFQKKTERQDRGGAPLTGCS